MRRRAGAPTPNILFDTSVLVAGLVEAHPEFPRSALWLDAADRGEVQLLWSTHAYAETWSVLTRLPLAERLDPGAVNEVLSALSTAHPPSALTPADYHEAAKRCAVAGLRSGAIFDALHLHLAERLGADALFTFNLRDFTRLDPRVPVLHPPATLVLP